LALHASMLAETPTAFRMTYTNRDARTLHLDLDDLLRSREERRRAKGGARST
jgi:hypothetical protein